MNATSNNQTTENPMFLAEDLSGPEGPSVLPLKSTFHYFKSKKGDSVLTLALSRTEKHPNRYFLSYARCKDDDQFVKVTGRNIAEGRTRKDLDGKINNRVLDLLLSEVTSKSRETLGQLLYRWTYEMELDENYDGPGIRKLLRENGVQPAPTLFVVKDSFDNPSLQLVPYGC